MKSLLLLLTFVLLLHQTAVAQNYFKSSTCSTIMRGIENEFELQTDIDTNSLIFEAIDCKIRFVDLKNIRITAQSNKEAKVEIRTKSTNTLLETKFFEVKNIPLPILYVDAAEQGGKFAIKNGKITLQSPNELKPCYDPKFSIRNYEIKIEGLEETFEGESDQLSKEHIMKLVRHKSSYGKDKTLKVELTIVYYSPDCIGRKKTVEYYY